MMKRILACLVAAVCLLTSFAFAEGISMKVVNVNTAVNMRKGPSTDTEALTQVPVGTVVTDCVKEGKWYKVNYDGVVGYIRGDKLQALEGESAEAPAETPATAEGQPLVAEGQPLVAEGQPLVPEGQAPVAEGQPLVAEGQPLVAEGQPLTPAADEKKEQSVLDEGVENAPVASITEPTEYDDDFVILDTTLGDVRVIGRQIFQNDSEYLMAVGLDASGNELWKKETTTDSITELSQTDVFIGGTTDAPLVLMYNACRGLTAINPATGEVAWEISKKTLDLGGSISHVLDDKGITYIGGYYGPDPVAIDAGGNVLWQANSGNVGATWLYRIEMSDEGIACSYGQMADADYGTIVYGFDGSVVSVVNE